jgi:hypothetical protein
MKSNLLQLIPFVPGTMTGSLVPSAAASLFSSYCQLLFILFLDKIKYVVKVAARFHNYCINKRILEGGDILINPVLEANVTIREIFQGTAEALAK